MQLTGYVICFKTGIVIAKRNNSRFFKYKNTFLKIQKNIIFQKKNIYTNKTYIQHHPKHTKFHRVVRATTPTPRLNVSCSFLSQTQTSIRDDDQHPSTLSTHTATMW